MYYNRIYPQVLFILIYFSSENMEKKSEIGENLKKLRKIRGFSQQDLAKIAGVAYNTIAKIEAGTNSNPTLETTLRLAKALGVNINELVY